MNQTLKFAVTAAVAALGMAGQAHALTNSTVNTSGSLFLYAFEDRTINPTATNSAIFDLGLANAFDTTKNQTFDFSNNSAWTTYIATIANPANIHWGVFGSALGNGSTGTHLLTTISATPATPFNGTAINIGATAYNTTISVYGGAACTTCGFNVVTPLDLGDKMTNSAGGMPAILTANLGSSMDFYGFVSKGTKASVLSTETNFATGGDPDFFTLSSNGVLTYTATAAVPEADSYAMMLAGVGLVGYMVRRRKTA